MSVDPSTMPAVGLEALVDHEWVRMPTAERFPMPGEPRLVFLADGALYGYDGCNMWTDRIRVVSGVLSFRIPRASSLCASAQQEQLDGAGYTVVDDGDIRRLELRTESGDLLSQYVAVDTMPQVKSADLVRTWQAATGERLTIDDTGGVSLGPCEPAGEWALDADMLRITGFAAVDEATACAGGTISGTTRQLLEMLLTDGAAIEARADGDRLLVSLGTGGRDAWLEPVDPQEPELDLRRGTAYGFAPMTDVNSDFIVTNVSRAAGEPTFDTGWYTTQSSTLVHETDCFGGVQMRAVQWGDLALGFLRLPSMEAGQDRLWISTVGDPTTFAEYMRMAEPLPDAFGTRTIGVDGLGVGSTISDIQSAGFTLSNIRAADSQPVTDPADATSARLDSLNIVTIELDAGRVTSIIVQNPGFC
ncbi:MAG TPA: hypothetical protein VHN36_09340 [Ilumatobacteraceae bacterium]|nr:hypothetical protein [Ilumatobacteraceae bacterium]